MKKRTANTMTDALKFELKVDKPITMQQCVQIISTRTCDITIAFRDKLITQITVILITFGVGVYRSDQKKQLVGLEE